MQRFPLLFSAYFLSLLIIFMLSASVHRTYAISAALPTDPVSDLPIKVFLPLSVFQAGSNVQSTSVEPMQETLPRYTATYYSFDYPVNWQIEESKESNYIVLFSASDKASDSKIEFAYLGYEISDEENLLEWYNKYTQMGIGEVPERKIIAESSVTLPDGTISRRLHEQHVSGDGSIQAVLIEYGNLVLSINAYSTSVEMTERLTSIAAALEFTADAPKTLTELYKTTEPLVTTLDQVLALNVPPVGVILAPATISTEQEVPEGMSIPSSVSHSDEFTAWEKLYQQLRENGSIGESADNGSPDGAVTAAGVVVPERQALSANFRSPVDTAVSVGCSSSAHTGRSAYAADIQVGNGSQVFAANSGTIYYAAWLGDWGFLIRIYSDVTAAGGTRRYYHNYAHLSLIRVASGDSATISDWIANSGNTGNSTGPHLHLHITRDVNFNDVDQYAADLSPLGGFRPNLNYPVSGTCGVTESSSTDPIIIEPVAYTNAYQPRSDHSWNCSTYFTNQHTTECYMAVVPLTNWGIDPLVTTQSPELRYANVRSYSSGDYYIWLCGRGGTLDDDSVYMGVNGASPASAQRITGYDQNAWVWKSIKMDNQRPYLNLSGSLPVINLWAREDGMRVDRILLTKDVNYNPTGNIRCGGY